MKKSIKLLSVVLLALMMVFTSSLRVMAADVTVTYSIVNRSIDGVENKKPLVTTELVVSGETPKNVPTELPTAPEGYYSTGWRYKTATMPEALPVEGEITDFVVTENITFSYGVWQNDYTQIEADFSVGCNLEWHVAAVSDTDLEVWSNRGFYQNINKFTNPKHFGIMQWQHFGNDKAISWRLPIAFDYATKNMVITLTADENFTIKRDSLQNYATSSTANGIGQFGIPVNMPIKDSLYPGFVPPENITIEYVSDTQAIIRVSEAQAKTQLLLQLTGIPKDPQAFLNGVGHHLTSVVTAEIPELIEGIPCKAPELVTSLSDQIITEDTPVSLPLDLTTDVPSTAQVLNLPEGLTYNSETKQIEGYTTLVGDHPITVIVTNSLNESTEYTFNLTVKDIVPTLSDVTMTMYHRDSPLGFMVYATADDNTVISLPNPGTFTLSDTNSQYLTLLDGTLVLNDETRTAEDQFSTVTSALPVGVHTVTVKAADDDGNVVESVITVTVLENLEMPDYETTVQVNTPLEQIFIKGNYELARAEFDETLLPDGVTYDPEQLMISGTPTKVGTYVFEVTGYLTDESTIVRPAMIAGADLESATATYTIHVVEPPVQPEPTPTPTPEPTPKPELPNTGTMEGSLNTIAVLSSLAGAYLLAKKKED